MSKLFEILANAEKSSKIALDNEGRNLYPVLGVVVDHNDPENKRRIKVALPSAPQFQSDWLRRLSDSPFVDPPLPEIGQTVLCLWVNGLESEGCYLSLGNLTNPPLDKSDPVKDYAAEIPGDRTNAIAGQDKLTAGKGIDIVAEENIALESNQDVMMTAAQDIQASSDRDLIYYCLRALVLHAESYLRLQAGPNNIIQLGADGSSLVQGNWNIDCAGGSINFTGASNITIDGKRIAVVGGTDSDGDTITNAGW
jgi:hypothetical protein